VIVYEGHVKVTGSGQTVNVAPGNTVAVAPNAPPRTITDDQRAVAGAPPRTVPPPPDCNAMIARGQNELQQGLDAQALRTFESAFACDPALDTESNHTLAYMAACRARDEGAAKRHFAQTPADKRETIAQICLRNGIDSLGGKPVPASISRRTADDAIDTIRPAIDDCRKTFAGAVTAQFRVTPAGVVSQVTTDPSSGPVAQCIAAVIRGRRFPATQRGGLFTYTFQLQSCDAEALIQDGQVKMTQGLDASALVAFERALKCKPDAQAILPAFMAACRSRNEPKARIYYKKLPADKRDSISQICVRNGITF